MVVVSAPSFAVTALPLLRIVGASMAETMQEMMEREKAEAIATLKRANSALSRIFGIEEEDNE